MLEGKKSQFSGGADPSTRHTDHQQQVRLSRQQQDELVERHWAGAFKKELARAYGVHVETVRAIIGRAAKQG